MTILRELVAGMLAMLIALPFVVLFWLLLAGQVHW